MEKTSQKTGLSPTWSLRDWIALTKPKVVLVMLFTVMVGFLLGTDLSIDLFKMLVTLIGVGACAASGAVLNHLVDRFRDTQMQRTKRRPVATGRIATEQAFIFSMLLLVIGAGLLYWLVNPLTAALSVASMFGYGVVYTLWLKNATPQNITVGGLAGAMPPLLGYTAVTGQMGPEALLWVLIIFTWTPPHFWALAIYKQEDYANAGVPMLPVTHGKDFTAFHAWLYSLLLCLVSTLPVLIGSQGLVYLAIASYINIRFCWLNYRMWCAPTNPNARRTFKYSIIYIMWLFAALLLDHYVTLIASS
jgi:protoheme IX farnesyltransferase